MDHCDETLLNVDDGRSLDDGGVLGIANGDIVWDEGTRDCRGNDESVRESNHGIREAMDLQRRESAANDDRGRQDCDADDDNEDDDDEDDVDNDGDDSEDDKDSASDDKDQDDNNDNDDNASDANAIDERVLFFDRVRRLLALDCVGYAALCLLLEQRVLQLREYCRTQTPPFADDWCFAVRFKGEKHARSLSLDALILLLAQTCAANKPIERFYVRSGAELTKSLGSALSVPCALGRLLLEESRRREEDRLQQRNNDAQCRAPLRRHIDITPHLCASLGDNVVWAQRHSVAGIGLVLAVNLSHADACVLAQQRFPSRRNAVRLHTSPQLPFQSSPLIHWLYIACQCNTLVEALCIAHRYAAGVLDEGVSSCANATLQTNDGNAQEQGNQSGVAIERVACEWLDSNDDDDFAREDPAIAQACREVIESLDRNRRPGERCIPPSDSPRPRRRGCHIVAEGGRIWIER